MGWTVDPESLWDPNQFVLVRRLDLTANWVVFQILCTQSEDAKYPHNYINEANNRVWERKTQKLQDFLKSSLNTMIQRYRRNRNDAEGKRDSAQLSTFDFPAYPNCNLSFYRTRSHKFNSSSLIRLMPSPV